jgi:hypothetical protein
VEEHGELQQQLAAEAAAAVPVERKIQMLRKGLMAWAEAEAVVVALTPTVHRVAAALVLF